MWRARVEVQDALSVYDEVWSEFMKRASLSSQGRCMRLKLKDLPGIISQRFMNVRNDLLAVTLARFLA